MLLARACGAAGAGVEGEHNHSGNAFADGLGRAVQVDPGFYQLTPLLLSALETKM